MKLLLTSSPLKKLMSSQKSAKIKYAKSSTSDSSSKCTITKTANYKINAILELGVLTNFSNKKKSNKA